MRGSHRSSLIAALVLASTIASLAIAQWPGDRSALRAERRAYAGSPPVIPHEPLGARCTNCHGGEPITVKDLGISPASPHSNDGRFTQCRQCHVSVTTDGQFRPTSFAGLAPVGEETHRASPIAPPVIPHPIFMREKCLACHSGGAARAELRTTHPERTNCRQCHLAGPAAARSALPPSIDESRP